MYCLGTWILRATLILERWKDDSGLRKLFYDHVEGVEQYEVKRRKGLSTGL